MFLGQVGFFNNTQQQGVKASPKKQLASEIINITNRGNMRIGRWHLSELLSKGVFNGTMIMEGQRSGQNREVSCTRRCSSLIQL